MRQKLASLRSLSARTVAAGTATLLPALAMAQTDPFTDAVTSMTTKVTSYGGALVTFSAVAIAFYIAMKFVKKLPKAA